MAGRHSGLRGKRREVRLDERCVPNPGAQPPPGHGVHDGEVLLGACGDAVLRPLPLLQVSGVDAGQVHSACPPVDGRCVEDACPCTARFEILFNSNP